MFMKDYILGLNLPLKSRCHESGVALIDMDGQVIFAANEERFSRIKQDGDFPEKAIAKMFGYTGVTKEEIKYVAVPTLTNWQKPARFMEFFWRERLGWLFKISAYKAIWKMVRAEKNAAKSENLEQEDFKLKYYWRDFISKNFFEARIMEYDHHLCHAAGAYYGSPWDNALIITIDGAGNFLSLTVAHGRGGEIKLIDKTFIPHSLGTFWGSITRVCGFKSGTRHGGKVTGLAASGNPAKLIEKFRQAIWCDGLRVKAKSELFFDPNIFVPNWSSYEPKRMKEYIGEASREDIAAAAQKRLEEVVCQLVKNARKIVPTDKIVLAGGVFANVLLNQSIYELPEIDDVFVFPAMSDGGLAMGASLNCLSAVMAEKGEKLMPKPLGPVYFGPDYSNREIEESLKKFGIKYRKLTEPARQIARFIVNNKIIAFYNGRMEYGPRALGSRSIIYAPIDPTVNDWLNKKLRRSEFMPFAPVTMIEHIKENYLNISDDPLAAKYMTITYDCTELMKKQAPACVHLDGTARPQVIKREDNPYYYDIINEYYKLSGIPTLINTSFNMHEEPIVNSPEDAIRAFLDSGIDYLVMGDYICGFEDNKNIGIAKI